MLIQFEKKNHKIKIELSDEPKVFVNDCSYKYNILSFTIDDVEMGNEKSSVKYYTYSFDYFLKDNEKVFCLYLQQDLAEKVTVALGLEKRSAVSLVMEDDFVKYYEEVLVTRAKKMVEEVKKEEIEKIKEADKNICDDDNVRVNVSCSNKYLVCIDSVDSRSFVSKEIEEKLNIYNDYSILQKFKHTFGTSYSVDYFMTYKELKELIASIDDAVEEKKIALEKEAKEKEAKEVKEKEEREKYYNSYEIVKKVELTYPKGGESGTDGYYRVIIKEKATGEEFEVVLRNVFDAGCWTLIYSKTIDEPLTDSEKRACKWVYDHAPFTTSVRM